MIEHLYDNSFLEEVEKEIKSSFLNSIITWQKYLSKNYTARDNRTIDEIKQFKYENSERLKKIIKNKKNDEKSILNIKLICNQCCKKIDKVYTKLHLGFYKDIDVSFILQCHGKEVNFLIPLEDCDGIDNLKIDFS